MTDRQLAEAVAGLPTGRYRWVLGAARRLWRQKHGKSPRLPRTIRMTAADELWARNVKHRDRGKCVVCGARRRVEAAHIVSRKYKKLRCSVDNGVTLCPSCHQRAHRAPWFLSYIVHVVIDPQQRERLTNTALFHCGDAIRRKEEWAVLFGDR